MAQKIRAILSISSGNEKYETIKLKKAGTIFGRENGDILLNDSEVSSTHCQIQYIEGDYYLFDMNSSNGTLLNGKPIVKQKLKTNDLIVIGKTKLTFTLESEQSVQHISTISQTSKELYAGHEKISIVDSLIEKEKQDNINVSLLITVSYRNTPAEEHIIKQKSLYLGRATSFGPFEHDESISRRHLLIKLNENGDVFIEDQGSANGSFLNEKKIHGLHLVSPDDLIRIGSCTIKLKALTT